MIPLYRQRSSLTVIYNLTVVMLFLLMADTLAGHVNPFLPCPFDYKG